MNQLMIMPITRTLRARTYDAPEFASLAFGGIGAERGHTRNSIPYCVFGYCSIDPTDQMITDLQDVMNVNDNDYSVRAVNIRKKKQHLNARISFADWCKELGIVRGE